MTDKVKPTTHQNMETFNPPTRQKNIDVTPPINQQSSSVNIL